MRDTTTEGGRFAVGDRATHEPDPQAVPALRVGIPSAGERYEHTPWLHLRSQSRQHGEAWINGTRAGLVALRDAINSAIETGAGEAQEFSSDGEGYGVTVARCRTVSALGRPVYFNDVVQEMAACERRMMEPINKIYRKQSAEALDALRWCRANGNPHAQGIDTRRAETACPAPSQSDESPVGSADAPKL